MESSMMKSDNADGPDDSTNSLARFLLKAGTLFHLQGVPVRLESDTIILTHIANMSLTHGVVFSWQRAGQPDSGLREDPVASGLKVNDA
jgi:hypothetical protein